MQYDAFVVGFGLAGMALTQHLRARGKSVLVIDVKRPDSASRVASGLWNPVVMRRFNPAWRAAQLMPEAERFYQTLEEEYALSVWDQKGIIRVFANAEEAEAWESQRLAAETEGWLSPIQYEGAPVATPFGYGELKYAGTLNVPLLLDTYRQQLQDSDCLSEEELHYDDLQIDEAGVRWQGKHAKHLIFCEGERGRQNPWFSDAQINPKKGEVITVEAPDLQSTRILRQSVFVIPQPENRYWIGSTFNHGEEDTKVTSRRRAELLEKFARISDTDVNVVEQRAGIRPTTRDKKPLAGTHPDFPALGILNGMGTRGVTLAPWSARCLVDHLLDGIPMPEVLDWRRKQASAHGKGVGRGKGQGGGNGRGRSH